MSNYSEITLGANREDSPSQRLLKGAVSPHEFLRDLLAADQKTDTHYEAKSTIEVLESSEIADYFLTHEQEQVRDEYHNLLSLSYFHAAQLQAIEEHSDPTEYFSRAYIEAETIESDSFGSWKLYVFGTIKYLEEDPEGLDFAINLINDEINKHALQRLKAGLLKYASVDYARDYPT